MAAETICHVLFDCTVSRQMLDLAAIPSLPNGFSTISVEANIKYILGIMENEELAEGMRRSTPWVMWAIWKNQNVVLIPGIQRDLWQLIQKAQEGSDTLE